MYHFPVIVIQNMYTELLPLFLLLGESGIRAVDSIYIHMNEGFHKKLFLYVIQYCLVDISPPCLLVPLT